ncbi:MAG: HAD family hydrolase [Sphingomonadales bacterium]
MKASKTLPPDFVKDQIEKLSLVGDRPLIICDADEVLVQFVAPLEAFLNRQGCSLRLRSFALVGNVFDSKTGEELDRERVFGLIDGFFTDCVADCLPVEGAVEALESLRGRAEIVILTNVPHHARQARQEVFAAQGMPYPLIANAGQKGPAVKALTAAREAPVIFVDDIPFHHASVAEHAGSTHRIHFVADPRLQKLLEPAEHAHVRIDDWALARDHIDEHLKAAGY